jgi:hypothetical protein
MNFKRSAVLLALALTVSTVTLLAQGPLYDTVFVNLPYTVTIGNRTLQPGDYVIKQLPSDTDSPVLLIYSDNGMKFQTSAMTIPTLDINTPSDTTVVLHHIGPDYYFDKIWIQGKNYGYEFPLPNSVKERERELMQPVNVAATYKSTPAEETEETETAENTPPQPPQAAPTPAPAPAPPAPAQAAPAPQPAPAPASEGSANREMPATAAGWAMMLLSGGALSGVGLMLRRKRG